ncbi:MAG TPA: DUF2892 domain-containing protein [Flavipsychrobacter sp.]|nr:DUF2892 domain-containing protein [Flavipsychrobacter sp.]
MKSYFRFMASNAGRWLRAILGFAIIAFGYNYYDEWGLWLIGTGTVVLIAAVFDWNPFGPLFGYPVTGRGMRAKYGSHDDIPGEA